MKKKYILAIALSASLQLSAKAQTSSAGGFGPQQIVTTSALRPQELYAADLDGDGDQDVLSASSLDGKIAWYANDGRGNLSEQRVIGRISRVSSVYAADLDGDGDLDVLPNFYFEINGIWYENDGLGNFRERQFATDSFDAEDIYSADLDGDSDLDILLYFMAHRFVSGQRFGI